MHTCEKCAAAPGCPSARTRYALQCEAFSGPTVQPALPDELEQEFQAWLQDHHPAIPDRDDRREAYYQAGMYPPQPLC